MAEAIAKSKQAKADVKDSFAVIYRRAESPNATPADRAALREWFERKPKCLDSRNYWATTNSGSSPVAEGLRVLTEIVALFSPLHEKLVSRWPSA